MIVVVGGGISGLSSAWHLAQGGLPCTLIEKNSRLGGVIDTATWEGCLLEAGPDSFLAIKPEAAQLATELGLEKDRISSNDHLRVTYIWKKNRLIPLPDGMMMMAPTKIMPVLTSPLLGWSAKIRMALDCFRRPHGPKPERSVAEFVQEHFGPEAVDYLAEPLLAGVYGGDARALSADSVLARFVELEAKYGSLTRGALAVRRQAPPGEVPLFGSMRHGLSQLVDALAEKLAARMRVVHGEAEALARSPEGWRIRVCGEWMPTTHVILALPAYAAAALLAPLDAELARLLETVDYSSSMTVSLVWRPGRLSRRLEGFGFLVPGKERRTVRAGTWVHNKFPHRAPEGYSVIRCFLGGAGGEDVLEQSDETILTTVLGELRLMTGIAENPDCHRIVRWRRSMAQYTLGHGHRMRKIEERIAALPGILLAGNAYSGIGIPDCIRTGRLAAEKVLRTILPRQ